MMSPGHVPVKVEAGTLSRVLSACWILAVLTAVFDILGGVDFFPLPISGLFMGIFGPFSYMISLRPAADDERVRAAGRVLKLTRFAVVPLWLGAVLWLGAIAVLARE